jgi:FAD/FMN-containing dehydrogenase
LAGPLNAPDEALLERLRAALGPSGLRAAEPRDLEEPRGRYHGRAAGVLRPESAAALAEAVRLCAEAGVGLIPRSGGTGLVGGQVSDAAPPPLVVSFERMNRIREVDATGGVLVAEAGVVLADVQAAARAAGRLFPLSLASEGSAQIGGLLATNAGGIGVLRYGNARDLCLGVEAVLGDGTVLHGLSPLVKDNLGYNLRHLLIGSEGTLGLITAASLRLHPIPEETATAWVAVPGPGEAIEMLATMRGALGGAVSAFELIHAQGLAFLAEVLPDRARAPDLGSDWLVLLEAADARAAMIPTRLEEALAAAVEAGLATDALIAQTEAQRQVFWETRELLPEGNRLVGAVASHDVSLASGRIAPFISDAGAAVAAIDPELRINCFGHLGDGNLHYNVFPPPGRPREAYDAVRGRVTRTVHDLVAELGGSVAAEHGVGRLKVAELERYSDPGKLAAMRAIKAAMDPAGILNPGAVLDMSERLAPSSWGGGKRARYPDWRV